LKIATVNNGTEIDGRLLSLGEGSEDTEAIRSRAGTDSRLEAEKSEATPEPVSSPGKPACRRSSAPSPRTMIAARERIPYPEPLI